jgi:NAD(P)H-dependent FMN reductase
MPAFHLLVIAGSARAGALSVKLANAAAALARGAGADVHPLDLRALQLPVYDGDIEASSGIPAGATQLREAIAAADGLLLVTPEYNGFPTPLVINAFDWLSRLPAHDGAASGLATTANKVVGLLSSSPGPLGGLRAMNTLRQYLQMAFQMLVVPRQFALGRAHEAFDGTGALQDAKSAEAVAGVVRALMQVGTALRSA